MKILKLVIFGSSCLGAITICSGQTPLTAPQILAKAKAALGGEVRLRTIHALSLAGTREHFSLQRKKSPASDEGGAGTLYNLTLTFRLPKQYRKTEQEAAATGRSNHAILISCLNGDTAWSDAQLPAEAAEGATIQGFGASDSASQTAAIRLANAHYLLAFLLYTDPASHVSFSAPGEETRHAGDPHVMEVRGPDGFVARLLVDDVTGLPLSLTFDSIEWQFSNYKDVDGIRFPFRIKAISSGFLESDTLVSAYTLNPVLDDALFRASER